MTDWRQPMETLAREHLPEDVAATWISLLRPAARLYAPTADETVVGQLGGSPLLPEGADWPWWDDYGPLAFIASVDCGRLPAGDIALPDAGSLLFFFYDGQVDETVVGAWEPETQPGARVVYVPPGTPTVEATTPEELDPYPVVPLAARLIGTEPGWEHLATRQAFFAPGEEAGSIFDHPLGDDDFTEALGKLRGFRHQVGGYATPIQGPVEDEIAQMLLEDVEWDDPRRLTEPARWVLLAQFQSDGAADMVWGDNGTLYWLIRTEDLAAQRFDAAAFTWQC